MKKTLILICGLFSFIKTQAQMWNGRDTLYGNEWIVQGQSYFKFPVAKDGIYRLNGAAMRTAGMPIGNFNGNQVRLFRFGQEVPLFVSNNGAFTDTDFIEFYGQQHRTEMDVHLYRNGINDVFNPEYSVISDTAFYFLTWNTTPSTRRVATQNNNLTNLPAKEMWYIHTDKLIYRDVAIKNGVSTANDVYTAEFHGGEGYGTSLARDRTIAIPALAALNDMPVQFTIRWAGNNFPHRTLIQFKNDTVLDDSYNNPNRQYLRVYNFNVNASEVTTASSIRLLGQNADLDLASISLIQIKYARGFNFNNAPYFEFALPASATGKYIEIDNFNAGGTAPILWDLTNNWRMTTTLDGNKIRAMLPPSVTERQLVLVSTGNISSSIPNIRLTTFPDFKTDNGDFIFITSKRFLNDPARSIQNYANYRASATGGAYRTQIIDIQDIYNQFGYGLNSHPVALRNFIHFIHKNRARPQYVLLVGKSRNYRAIRTQAQFINEGGEAAIDLPVWGFPASDALFTMKHTDDVPVIPLGRVAATTLEDLKNYLDKVKALENAQYFSPQTIEARDWMKNIIHLNGGSTLGTFINSYMTQFGSVLSKGKTGSNITTFIKNSTEPVQPALSEKVFNRINDGTMLINFFGHSATSVLDFDINIPLFLKNENRYPILMAMGCSAGNVHLISRGVSEGLTLMKDKGVAGFVSTSGQSYLDSWKTYGDAFFKNISIDHYGKSIGHLLQATAHQFNRTPNLGLKAILQEITVNGDPSLKIHVAQGPDFVPDAATVKFTPSVLTAQNDSFKISFDVVNIGTVVEDSITIQIKQQLPTGSQIILFNNKIKSPTYRNTLQLTLPMQKSGSEGQNRLFITVDSDNKVAELPAPAAEANNELITNGFEKGISFFIYSNNVTPIFPAPFSIMSNTPIVLKASSSNALAKAQRYIFEIDTTALFNSPSMQRATISQQGGIIQWQPTVNWQDKTVYYWRTAIDSLTAQGYLWTTHSFTFDRSVTEGGWQQAHYYQFKENQFEGMTIDDSSRAYKYLPEFNTFEMRSNPNISANPIIIYNSVIIGQNQFYPNAGLYVTIIDDVSGSPVRNVRGRQYGLPSPRGFDIFSFVFDPTSDDSVTGRMGLIKFLTSVIPDGTHVILHTVQQSASSNLMPEKWAADSIQFGTNIFQTLEKYGAMRIRDIVQRGSVPYLFAFQKGRKKVYSEILALNFQEGYSDIFKIERSGVQGTMESPYIGPSKSWRSIDFNYEEVTSPPSDTLSFDVIGLDVLQNRDTILFKNIKSTTALNSVNAKQFPFLKLRFNARDSIQRTSPQLKRWRVLYDGVSDWAINPTKTYRFFSDTLQEADSLRVEVAFDNVGNYPSDSVKVRLSVSDEANAVRSFVKLYPPTPANGSITAPFAVDTRRLVGKNRVTLEINPDKVLPELNTFNNFLTKEFVVLKDQRNPLLDVTFDGTRIMNNDIVSARPLVVIQVKDDNKFLLLNDTALFRLVVTYPDNKTTRVLSFKDPSVRFIAASTATKNQATIEWQPTFTEDGTYRLAIAAKDITGNTASSGVIIDKERFDYSIAFQVITKSSISNVLNYPNPFSTATRFVYTLTGSDPPQYFKIQIMTVSGKVVREITQDEIGPLKIGKHITDFVWDGTDSFGDKLANGVYLYRIIAKKRDGSAFEKLEGVHDDLFKNDFGKLVIMR